MILVYKNDENKSISIKDSLLNNNTSNIEYYYNINLIVSFGVNSNNLFNIYLNTFDNEGNGFLGIEPGNCYVKPELYSNILKSCNSLHYNNTNNNNNLYNIVTVCLEIIDNKVLRIVGDYNNLSEY